LKIIDFVYNQLIDKRPGQYCK